MSSSEKDAPALLQEIEGLHETLKQIGFQNKMMLSWVNGAVINVDREGKVIQANDAALQALGWTLEEFTGLHMHEMIHHSQDDGSEYPWEFCPVFAAIEDGSSHHVDGDIFWQKNGLSFSADYIVCPTRNEVNEITGAVMIFRNLTEVKLQEAKRIHSLKLESIGELSAGIAHEINTPIQFIGNNVAFLQESFQDMLELLGAYSRLRQTVQTDDGSRELLEEIDRLAEETDVEYLVEEAPNAFAQTQDGVDRVTKLVLGLKGFAHSNEGDTRRPSDLNEIIGNALTVCRNAYKYVAEMETDLSDLPSVPVMAGDIGQVLVNLIVNAAHAIEEKRGEGDALGKITIKSYKDDNSAFISIADTGSGIPAGLRERIFDPFFTTKEVGKGSGQGLAISRTLIHDRHNGELSLSSKEGEGSTFIISLPLTKESV